MAGDLTKDSDRLLADGRSLLQDNRAGGRHRRTASIGRGSAEVKQRNLMTRIKLIGGSLLAIVLAASVLGIALNGIGFTGIMIAFLAVVACTFLFSNFPKVRVPKFDDLNTGDVRHLVSRTELWLEHQRPALPPPAVTLVDHTRQRLADQLARLDRGRVWSRPTARSPRTCARSSAPAAAPTSSWSRASARSAARSTG